MREGDILFLDIETVPSEPSYDLLSESMKALWARKSALIYKENLDFAQTYFERAGIYAEFGMIVCISLGFLFEEEGDTKFRMTSFTGDEDHILKSFHMIVQDFFSQKNKYFCGHNIKEFDIPFICRRSMIHGLSMPKVLADLQTKKPWELPLIDTLQLWRFGDYKNYTSLDLLAAVLGIESSKSDMDGSDVARVYYQEKDVERIASYCQKDVLTTARVYRKLKGEKNIEDGQVQNK